LSFNFQNIEVRAVLQLIADFTGLNMVASDTVTGNITLRLKNVPWDQALDIILKSKGLGMRRVGNVVMVAPQEEIAAREKLELEAERQLEELAPLRTEFIQVNYAKALSCITKFFLSDCFLLCLGEWLDLDCEYFVRLIGEVVVVLSRCGDDHTGSIAEW